MFGRVGMLEIMVVLAVMPGPLRSLVLMSLLGGLMGVG